MAAVKTHIKVFHGLHKSPRAPRRISIGIVKLESLEVSAYCQHVLCLGPVVRIG
jgi:hypothetical protein